MNADPNPRSRSRDGLLVLALAAVTAAVFSRMVFDQHDFVLFDDHLYVTRNPMVLSGINAESLRWALTAIVAANWHPLTVLSHMLDVELFGVERPWGHHLTSLLLHVATVVLLFLWLRRATGAVWCSALATAIFAWHPLRVESVAWVAERKDVLSGLFFVLTLWAYSYYVASRSVARYGLVALAMTLGLLAKPMLVTLPCVLLLLDWWPLGRISFSSGLRQADWRAFARLFAEKIPLFALVALFSVVTVLAQRSHDAVIPTSTVPPSVRVVNAAMSYNAYISKTVYPHPLAVPYPIQSRTFNLLLGLLSAVGIVLVTFVVWGLAKQWPYLGVGWFWYLGMLVPVIGLVQVGNQSMADRYTYLPSIGLSIIVAWSLAQLVELGKLSWRWATVGAIVALLVLAGMSVRQVGYWKDTITLFEHTLAHTEGNYVAHTALGTGYQVAGRLDEAIEQYQASMDISESYADGQYNLGEALRLRGDQEQGDLQRAIEHFQLAIEYGRDPATCHLRIALCQFELNDYAGAERHARLAQSHNPSLSDAERLIARAAARQGHYGEAVRRYGELLERVPGDILARGELARIYAASVDPQYRNGDEAVRLANEAHNAYHQRHGTYHATLLDTLAAAYAERGDFEKAEQYAAAAVVLLQQTPRKTPSTERHWREIAGRVLLYRQKLPFRETVAAPD